MSLFWRAAFITVLRFFAITALLTSLYYLDTSPLPEVPTILILSYLIHIAATFLFAKWVFGHRDITWGQIGMVAAVFVILGTFLEAGLSTLITRSPIWEALTRYNIQSLIIVLLYIAMVFLAGWQTRRFGKKKIQPGGMV
jgi:hypothetical protein